MNKLNRKKRTIFVVALILCNTLNIIAQEKTKMSYTGFSGGMMVHSGYLFGGELNIVGSDNNPIGSQTIEGIPFGIGGAMRFHFGKHLRVGCEGYSSTLNYGETGSYLTIGWGGILADYLWKHNKFSFFAGGTLGGGVVKNTTFFNKVDLDFIAEQENSFRKYGLMLCTPFVGVEYDLTSKIKLVLKTDYMIDITNQQPDFVNGVRFYLGFMFSRMN